MLTQYGSTGNNTVLLWDLSGLFPGGHAVFNCLSMGLWRVKGEQEHTPEFMISVSFSSKF